MAHIIEVAAFRSGGTIPLGIISLRQALRLPHAEDFRYRQVSEKDQRWKVISREELESLAKSQDRSPR